MSPKQRLFSEPEKHSENAHSGSRTNFEKIATKVFSIPKAEVDERETKWRKQKALKDRAPR